MKDNILNMINQLDVYQKGIIYHALVGMTSGLDTMAEMVAALDDYEAMCLLYVLEGLLT